MYTIKVKLHTGKIVTIQLENKAQFKGCLWALSVNDDNHILSMVKHGGNKNE